MLSSNFYWLGTPDHPDDLTALNKLPMVALTAKVEELEGKIAGQRLLEVTLHNPTHNLAVMAHVQLRRKSGVRVLPVFYSDNYVSLVPDETQDIEIEAAESDFNGEEALIVLDGWNVTVEPASFAGAAVAPNVECAARPLACNWIAVCDGGAALKKCRQEHRKTRNRNGCGPLA